MRRRGYVARLLQILTLLPLIRIAPVCCQYAEDYELTLLAAIRSNESGLEVRTLFPEYYGSSRASQWSDYDLEPQMDLYFIPNHNLSSECGDQYFRCQKLLVVCAQNDSGELSIIFVPLENGVLLLSYWHNSMMIERSIFIVNSSNCSPTVFYNINDKVYTVCINSHYLYAAVYEVQLNLSGSVTKFEGAEFVEPLVTSINLSSSQPLSNFVNVNHMIFFAVGNTIIVMDILDKTQTHKYPELPECAQIHKLISTTGTGNQQLLVANCTDRYIDFDPVFGDWTGIQHFSSDGVPYLCPDNSYRVTHFINGTSQFSVRGVLIKTINNVNINSGICFESQNRTYFAYSDQQHYNVNVYDFTTQRNYPVSPYDCSATPHKDCPQLLFLENQYLVIRDVICNHILDATMNFSLLINTSSGIADILAILHSNAHSTSEKTTSPVNNATVTTYTDVPTSITVRNNSVGIILTAIIGLIVIIVILVTVAVGFSIRCCRRKKWCSTASFYRTLRLRFYTNRSPPVSLLIAGSAQAEEEEEEEEGESYEMMGTHSWHSRESRFDKGWRWTTTV